MEPSTSPEPDRPRAASRWHALAGRLLAALREEARALLFPRTCLACSAPMPAPAWPAGLCASCRETLPWRPVSGDPTAAPLEVGRRRFDAVVVAMRYAPPVDELVLRLKYGGLAIAARPLAQALAHAVERVERVEHVARPELLVPIPMHPLKRWVRGGDHADELVEELARCLDRPVARLLRRRRATVAQGGARSLRERVAQVHRAFVVRSAAGRGRHVGLVDDVVTSGATAAAAALALRRAGARAVTLFAVAGNG